jgi:hypothetical protein
MSIWAGPSWPFFLFWYVAKPASSTIDGPQISVAMLKDDPGFRPLSPSCDIVQVDLGGND